MGCSLRQFFYRRNMLIRYLYLIYICLYVNDQCLIVSADAINCTTFINVYQERIIGIALPAEPITGVALKTCQTDVRSCCTPDLEDKLRELSKVDYEKALKKTFTSLSKMLKSKSVKFNEFFKDMLTKSKKDFHEMFKRTYGIVYEQNSYVFSNFFIELENYFSHGKTNLADVMDNFFTILYQKMFTVINSQYKFDEKYLLCVSEHMSDLKPFGDVPQKLSLPLKRSFVASRAYTQSLNVAGDIVANLINLSHTETCINAVTRMMHCPVCKGIVNIKGCNSYCLNIMKGCLAYHTEVDSEWNNFVDAMGKVEQRLIGPFNIELVVEPMNVKISEAIMNFQENAAQVSSKVFSGCGKPPLVEGRLRRQVSNTGFSELKEFDDADDENEDEVPQINNKRKNVRKKENNGKDGNRKKQKMGYNLEPDISSPVFGFLKFIKETGAQVIATRHFWKRLPYHICSEEIAVESNKNESCWNGNSIASYEPAVIGDGMKNQHLNPEVPVDIKRQSSLLNEQIYALRTITSQLRNAFNGMDVEWVDMEESYDAGSGDGDDGSGYPPDTDDEDAEYAGSGDHPIPHGPPIILDENINNNNNFNPILFTAFTTTATTPTVIEDRTVTDNSSNADTFGKNHTTLVNIINYASNKPVSNTTVSVTTSWLSSTISSNSDGVGNVDNNNFNNNNNNDYNNDLRNNNNNLNNNVHNRNNTSSANSRYYSQISLNRAIASYLLPAVVMWIGGSFNEWFNSLV